MSARRWYSFLALTAVLGACAKQAEQQTAAAPPAVDSAAVRTAMGALWQKWIAADTAGNYTALLGLVDDSVRADIRGMPVVMGKAGFQTFLDGMKGTKVSAETVTPDMTIPVSNELAYQNGNYTETMTSKGKTSTDYGRYALAIRKGPDGQWRFAYVMAFADSTVAKKK